MEKFETKQYIMSKTKVLGGQHGVEEITVRAICDFCGISRQTFYSHFKDKYDLIGQIYAQTIQSVMVESEEMQSWSQVIGKMLENVKKDHKFYQNALKFKGQNALTENMLFYVHTGYIHEIERRLGHEINDKELLYAIRYNAHGGVGCMLDWIYNGMKEDPYVISANIISCMPSRMRQYFC